MLWRGAPPLAGQVAPPPAAETHPAPYTMPHAAVSHLVRLRRRALETAQLSWRSPWRSTDRAEASAPVRLQLVALQRSLARLGFGARANAFLSRLSFLARLPRSNEPHFISMPHAAGAVRPAGS